MLELIFKIRQWFASAPALIVLVLSVLSVQSVKLLDSRPAAPQVIQLSMVSLPTPLEPAFDEPEPDLVASEEATPPEPALEEPEPDPTLPIEPEPEPEVPAPIVEVPKPEPPKPKKVKPKEHKPVEPKPKEPRMEKPKPVETKKTTEPKNESVEPEATRNAAQPPVAEVVAPEPILPEPEPRKSNRIAEAEASYVAQVRAILNANKRYPTGREASLTRPAGTVRVWIVINRQGEVVDTGIEKSSHSMLLDRTARSTVRRSTFPPFPADAWIGADTRRFTVDMNYQPAR